MPQLVITGSAITAAIPPAASATSRASTSLNSTATAAEAWSKADPTAPSRGTVRPPRSRTIVSSTSPW